MAPACIASETLPSCKTLVSAITSTCGISALIRVIASIPSTWGMRMSISTTSGLNRRASSIASRPSEASPTTVIADSCSRNIRNPCRTSQWSSSTRLLIEALDYIVDQSEAALVELRSLIFGLRPESVAEEGLVAGLRRLTAALAARHKLHVEIVAETEPDIDDSAKEAIYRIAQESLQNVVKHASARAVRVQLVSEGDKVE